MARLLHTTNDAFHNYLLYTIKHISSQICRKNLDDTPCEIITVGGATEKKRISKPNWFVTKTHVVFLHKYLYSVFRCNFSFFLIQYVIAISSLSARERQLHDQKFVWVNRPSAYARSSCYIVPSVTNYRSLLCRHAARYDRYPYRHPIATLPSSKSCKLSFFYILSCRK